jgi:purine-binding chemotaxis protein CheW
MSEKRQFSSFYVNNLMFGIAVEEVQEIAGALAMTTVPLAPAKVAGLINLRGQIIPAIDLRTCLQIEGERTERPAVNMILHSTGGYSSLLVDRVGEIIEVDDSAFELPPETLKGPARELIQGTYKLEGKLMHVLELERTLRVS